MGSVDFEFKGGVHASPASGTCKFLLFLLNGAKEISLSQAVKLGFAEHKAADSIVNWTPNAYCTEIPVAKVLLYEDGGFGKQKFSQQFWLAMGKKLEKQVVTIKPRLEAALAAGFYFRAEAAFLKKSEVLALVDPDSISAKVMRVQQLPAASVLRQIVQIERIGVPQALKVAEHGGIRKLRIR